MPPVGPMQHDKQILGNLIRRMQNPDVDPLGPLIDRYFLERNLPGKRRLRSVTIPLVERPRPPGRLSPSSMNGCMRAAVFKYVGMRGVKRVDPEAESIFDDGNWRHHRWQALFRDMQRVLGKDLFKVLAVEESVSIDDLYVTGNLDICIWIRGIGKIVVDFKGINDRGFTQVVTTDAPIAKHEDQLRTYMKARGIKLGLLMYENKNDQRFQCYIVRWDEDAWQATAVWAQKVIEFLANEKLPNRDIECSAGTYMFDRCPYAKWCFGEKSHATLTRIAFRNFPGVNEAWEASHQE